MRFAVLFVLLVSTAAVAALAQQSADPVVFSFVLSADDAACVERVTKQKPETWLESHLRQLVSECTAAERRRAFAEVGIVTDLKAAGLTQDEIDAVLALRRPRHAAAKAAAEAAAKAAADAAATAATPPISVSTPPTVSVPATEPAAASPTAVPR